jgi:hypothetical protein
VEFLPDGGHAVPSESWETMTRRPRRNHTPGFKAKVALTAIKGDRTLAELAEQLTSTPIRSHRGRCSSRAGVPTFSVQGAATERRSLRST